MRINQNIAAFNSYRNLSVTNTVMGKSLEKLSSGYRINRASDDASGLVKSEGLRAEIGGTKVAIRNAQDGISFVQTAEGALDEVHSILQRMRDLAVSAANGTSDGSAEQAEFTELRSELDAIGSRTTFAGSAVFSSYATTAKVFQIGAASGNTLSISLDLRINTSATAAATAAATEGIFTTYSSDSLALLTLNASDATAAAAISKLDSAISAVSTTRSKLGAAQNRLEATVRNLSVAAENLQAAESRIRDTDMAEEMVKFTRHQILSQAGTAMLAQANQVPQGVLSLLR